MSAADDARKVPGSPFEVVHVVPGSPLDVMLGRLLADLYAPPSGGARTWFIPIGADTALAPIDHTGGAAAGGCCDTKFLAVTPEGVSRFPCTRVVDHTGRHASGQGGRVVAVWGRP